MQQNLKQRMDKKLFLAACAILVMMSLAAASYLEVSCGVCGFTCPAGITPTVRCRHDDSVSPPTPVCGDCELQCAKACGEATTCIETGAAPMPCQTCCDSVTCSGYPAYDQILCYIPIGARAEACACENACMGTCKFNTNFCYMIILVCIVAGIMGAIMLLLLALKWITSDDPQGRTEARRGIWYVIVGIIVIISASALVGALLGSTIPCQILPQI
jgi:hypothetical protein